MIDEHEENRRVTREEYVRAFEAWASVANLTDDEQGALAAAIAAFRAAPDDGGARPVDEYCQEALPLLSGAGGTRLRLSIIKSCLLHRMIYLGEPLRTEKCPIHQGQWSGIKFERCPHGCDATCGCSTGWLPTKGAA